MITLVPETPVVSRGLFLRVGFDIYGVEVVVDVYGVEVVVWAFKVTPTPQNSLLPEISVITRQQP